MTSPTDDAPMVVDMAVQSEAALEVAARQVATRGGHYVLIAIPEEFTPEGLHLDIFTDVDREHSESTLALVSHLVHEAVSKGAWLEGTDDPEA